MLNIYISSIFVFSFHGLDGERTHTLWHYYYCLTCLVKSGIQPIKTSQLKPIRHIRFTVTVHLQVLPSAF